MAIQRTESTFCVEQRGYGGHRHLRLPIGILRPKRPILRNQRRLLILHTHLNGRRHGNALSSGQKGSTKHHGVCGACSGGAARRQKHPDGNLIRDVTTGDFPCEKDINKT